MNIGARSITARWMASSSSFCVGLLLILAATAFGQYRFDHWTAETGLPQNIITALHQSPEGYLWIATLDGLTRFGAFIRMVVPISLSGILTVVIFTFTLVTQEYVYALTFISPESQQMVGVGIPIFLVRGDVYFWGSLMAACLIASLPIAFIYNLFLDRFIAGRVSGSLF